VTETDSAAALRAALGARLVDDFTVTDQARLGVFGEFYRGKVRDLYIGSDEIVMVTTDRLSAFDVVLGSIPCKGAILNAITVAAFESTADICPNHLLDCPHPNIMRVRRAEALKAEIIVRRYITGSLWRDYQSGKARAYGIDFPEGLRPAERFEKPIVTPSTKAEQGEHDEPISEVDLVARGFVERDLLEQAVDVALRLFARGEELAARQGLLLVDTKYEFGLVDGKLVVIDEIHTADSSRYWVADEYEQRFNSGIAQKMLDKENIRQWLAQRGYLGEGAPPDIPYEVRVDLAVAYAELHGRLLGSAFDPSTTPPPGDLYAALGVA